VWNNIERADNISNSQSLQTSCGWELAGGLTCRVNASLYDFLALGALWYFRAMDDTWVNPANMRDYLDKLEQIVDPYKHLVIKADVYRYLSAADFVQGGSGVLLSRAAVEYPVRLNFTYLTDISYAHHEDVAFTFPCFAFFNETRQWAEFRFIAHGG
jgi:hypothetical protein